MRPHYRHEITIKQPGTTQNSFGEQIETWSDVVTCKASIEPLIGREFYAAKQINSEISVKIRIRHSSSHQIKPNMIAVYGTRIFEIISVSNYKEQNRETLLMCKERGS